MTDLTSDLSTTGMPFLNFQMYALHVLFPGLDDHPVLHQNKVKNFTQLDVIFITLKCTV